MPLKDNNSWLKDLAKACFGIIVGYGITFLNVEYLESYLYDLRVRLKPQTEMSGTIEMIVASDKTQALLGHAPEFSDYNRLLEKLSKSSPRMVIVDTDLKKLQGSLKDKVQFVVESQKFPQFIQATQEHDNGEAAFLLPAPLTPIALSPAPRTHDKNILAKDSVTRRMMLHYLDRDMLYFQVAKAMNPEMKEISDVRGVFDLFESAQTYVDFHKPGSFPTSSMEDVIAGKANLERFNDKIVLIGEDLKAGFDDYILSPFSREALSMPRVEMQANMLETLIQNSGPIRTQTWIDMLITILISVFTVHIVLTVRPAQGIAILLLSAVVILLVGFLALWPFGIWLPITHPLLSLFLVYYFFIPYRLIVENRRSWEYFQKHRLLSEVEVLKTNFIGMMSHDLKTPLARIQGMSEIIVKDASPLSTPQREALDLIRQSADDLLKFINTILNYARIESQGIELHRQSKDINQLLLEVIKKNEFLAKLKHIQLIPELETLFSISVDPELIKQVFSNLIENAIKYSPDHSKVLVTTEEVDGWVRVQFADQGPGIPEDEIENIFMKFFRSRNAKTSPVKGSGLGLYLAKYFVELHGGKITVESQVGAGCTFTVELPLDVK